MLRKIYSFIIHVDIVSDGARTIKLKAVADAKLFCKQRRKGSTAQ